MATALFRSVVFGPVQSRRLGVSLGVNLLPNDNKLCNFDCIYCECGWNTGGSKPRFNDRQTVRRALKEALVRRVGEAGRFDAITFSGNGEPTLHPDFEGVIDDTIALRDTFMPAARISVLSNATRLGEESVRRALSRVDNNILKLDSAFDDTVRLIDRPNDPHYSVARIVEEMKKFEGRMILQTMFLRGTLDGRPVDNATEKEVAAWLGIVEQVRPRRVMVYTIDRDTPARELSKVPVGELEAIAERVRALGIECEAAG